jgi:hypothetical protein
MMQDRVQRLPRALYLSFCGGKLGLPTRGAAMISRVCDGQQPCGSRRGGSQPCGGRTVQRQEGGSAAVRRQLQFPKFRLRQEGCDLAHSFGECCRTRTALKILTRSAPADGVSGHLQSGYRELH